FSWQMPPRVFHVSDFLSGRARRSVTVRRVLSTVSFRRATPSAFPEITVLPPLGSGKVCELGRRRAGGEREREPTVGAGLGGLRVAEPGGNQLRSRLRQRPCPPLRRPTRRRYYKLLHLRHCLRSRGRTIPSAARPPQASSRTPAVAGSAKGRTPFRTYIRDTRASVKGVGRGTDDVVDVERCEKGVDRLIAGPIKEVTEAAGEAKLLLIPPLVSPLIGPADPIFHVLLQ
ncbi:hypothetical protein B296_00039867, partial [Ensete ventricosum]